jgi:hypothetical protein
MLGADGMTGARLTTFASSYFRAMRPAGWLVTVIV